MNFHVGAMSSTDNPIRLSRIFPHQQFTWYWTEGKWVTNLSPEYQFKIFCNTKINLVLMMQVWISLEFLVIWTGFYYGVSLLNLFIFLLRFPYQVGLANICNLISYRVSNFFLSKTKKSYRVSNCDVIFVSTFFIYMPNICYLFSSIFKGMRLFRFKNSTINSLIIYLDSNHICCHCLVHIKIGDSNHNK